MNIKSHVCLCVHADTVLLCLKHHVRFQQEEWKAMPSRDTFLLTQQTETRRDSVIMLPPSPQSHFLLHPLSPLKGAGSQE